MSKSGTQPGAGSHHLDLFLEMLSAERGASPNTLEAYRRDLQDFLNVVKKRRRDALSAARGDIVSYLQTMAVRGLKASTRARKLSSLRQFFRFLYGEGIRSDDPAATIESPKPAKPLPKVLSVKDVDKLLEEAEKRASSASGPKRLKALRLHCLMEILYASGLRVI